MLRLLLTWCLLAPGIADAARWAVVVGVSHYEDPDLPSVDHARADAEAVRDWLVTVGGVPPANLWLLLDEGAPALTTAEPGQPLRASRSNLLDVLHRGLGAAGPDDTVFVYFSGQATATSAGAATLMPVDGRLALADHTGVAVPSVQAAVQGTPVLWLDTSVAGRGAAHEGSGGAALGAGIDRGVLWYAAGPQAVAEEADRAPHGAFTNALLRSLRSTDGSLQRTWVQLGQQLSGHPAPWGRHGTVPDLTFADAATALREHPRVVAQAGHGSAIQAVAWHPSRPWLASADATGIVQVADLEAREIRLRFPSGRRGVRSLAFSDDGQLLYAVGADGVARAWTTAEGTLQWEHAFSALDQLPVVSTHGDRVAIGSTRGRITTVQGATGKRSGRWRVGPANNRLRSAHTHGLAWSADGRSLASAADNGELSVWWLRPNGRTGKRMRRQPLRRAGSALHSVVWSEGQLVTGGADGRTEVWSLDEGLLATLPSNGFSVQQVAARPGHPEVAVAADTVRLWELGSEQPRVSLPTAARTTAVTWSPSGDQLATGHTDGQLRVWSAETGEELGTLPGQRSAVEHVAVRGAHLAVLGHAGAQLWDLRLGRPAHQLSDIEGVVHDAVFAGPDHLVLGGADGVVRWWNVHTGVVDHTWSTSTAVSALDTDGRSVAVGAGAEVHVLSETGTEQHRWSASDPVQDLSRCGPEGNLVVLAGARLRSVSWLTGEPRSPTRRGQHLACDADRQWVAVAQGGGAIGMYEADGLDRSAKGSMSAQTLLRDPAGTLLGERRLSSLAFHPSEPWLVAGAEGATTQVWDLEEGRRRLELDTYGSRAVAFVAQGGLVVTGGAEGTIRLWDEHAGTLLATAVMLHDDWLVWAPDGLFDGSPDGQRTLFRWRMGETMHPPSKFNRGYYQPGLLAALARGERPRAQRDISTLSPPPRVRITSPSHRAVLDSGFVEVGIRVDDQGGGISEPRLYLNGHRVSGTRGIEAVGPQSADTPDLTFRVELMEGDNHLRATAFNADGTWESLGDEVAITWQAPVTEPPRLHVLAVGVDAYQDRRLTLGFARDDAEAISGFFDAGLFREVVPHVLLDEQASLAGIRAAFRTIAEDAAPRDALLVYFAGHGVMNGEVFYYLPWDVEVSSDDDVARTGLSQAELGDALARVPAAKQLVVLDACHSGGAMQGLAQALATRATPGLIRAQQRLADSTGAFLVAASTEAQLANEIPELGHGVLTYAILEGLGENGIPAANRDLDGHITVGSLIQYVSQLVPRLTDQYHRQRQEVVQSASGQDFPLVAP